jgi:lambda repressor-like predicted transcriptional regulator
MSNERLRAAIDKAGLSVDQLGLTVQADSKTVRRWISGRTPRKIYRLRVADALNTTEADLWPEEELRVDGRDEQAEILAAYTHTNDQAAPDWRALLTRASSRVDLIDLTLTDILKTQHAETLLSEKAGVDGCAVRLLFSAPESAYLTLTDAELGQDLTLVDIPESAQDANHTINLLPPLLTAGVQVRTFVTARPNTILRFDDEMLISLQLYATPAEHAPLLHLKRHSNHGLFQAFADQYDLLWQDATPITANPIS